MARWTVAISCAGTHTSSCFGLAPCQITQRCLEQRWNKVIKSTSCVSVQGSHWKQWRGCVFVPWWVNHLSPDRHLITGIVFFCLVPVVKTLFGVSSQLEPLILHTPSWHTFRSILQLHTFTLTLFYVIYFVTVRLMTAWARILQTPVIACSILPLTCSSCWVVTLNWKTRVCISISIWPRKATGCQDAWRWPLPRLLQLLLIWDYSECTDVVVCKICSWDVFSVLFVGTWRCRDESGLSLPVSGLNICASQPMWQKQKPRDVHLKQHLEMDFHIPSFYSAEAPELVTSCF